MSEDLQGAPSAPGTPGAPEIYAALRALAGEPYGLPRSARTEELVEAAELGGLDEPLATGLLSLVDAYEFGLEPRKLPLAFARALKLYDAKPAVFDEREVHRLYWCFKWVTSALIAVPEVPLATIQAWIDQMRERYAAAGHGLHAVEVSRFALAAHTGVDLDFRFECWSTRGRDEFSDCEACEARDRGRYKAERGDFARALEEWEPVLEGAVSCAMEPSATIAECLLALVRVGRLDEAASLHRSGYRLTRGQVSMAVEVGRHLEFAALTGNAPRGLELLAENRSRFDSLAEPLIELDFLTSVRILMARLVADGAADVAVPGPSGSAHTAASLLAETIARTDALAASFDARNKTSRVSDRLRTRCAQEPLTETPLPLGVRSAPLLPAAAAPPIPARRTAAPEDFPALLAEAREASRIGRPDADGLWDLVVQQLGEREPDEELQAELATRAGTAASRRGSWSEARDQYARSRALMEAAGKPGRATLAWSRILWVRTLEGDDAAALWDELDAMRAAADALLADEQMTAENYCSALQSRVIAAALPIMKSAREDGTTPTEGAIQRFETEAQAMRDAAVRLGAAHYAARVDGIRADVLVATGDPAAALAALRSAVSVLDGCDRPWLLPLPLVQLAALVKGSGAAEEAKDLIHRALALAAQWPDDDFDESDALRTLADACRQTKDYAAAARHLADAAARLDRKGDARRAAYARFSLSQALREGGRVADAVAVLESMLGDEAEAQLSVEAVAQARLDLGRGLTRLGEHGAAAGEFVRLADQTSDWEVRAVHTMVVCELAAALARARLWDEARAAADRALAAHATAPDPASVCRMLRICADQRAQVQAGNPEALDEVLEYLRRADEVNEAAPEGPNYRRWPETANTAQSRAQCLAEAGRDKEALEAVERSIAAWQLGGDVALEPLAEATRIAAVIEGHRLGLTQQARDRLAPVITRCEARGLAGPTATLRRLSDSFVPAGDPGAKG